MRWQLQRQPQVGQWASHGIDHGCAGVEHGVDHEGHVVWRQQAEELGDGPTERREDPVVMAMVVVGLTLSAPRTRGIGSTESESE
jgi:hypothetical protein